MGTKHRGPERERTALDAYIKLTRSVNSINASVWERHPFPEGVTPSQFGVLEALYHLGPLNQQELGSKILKSKGNMSFVVEKLEKEGMVSRVRDGVDRRKIIVDLTAKGRAAITAFFPDHARAVSDAMSVLTREEQRELGKLCKKLGLGNG
jgi:MarR family 2-MHQ and catechol resistance regulon transcriptional repressor